MRVYSPASEHFICKDLDSFLQTDRLDSRWSDKCRRIRISRCNQTSRDQGSLSVRVLHRRDTSASAQRDASEGVIPFLIDARPDRDAPENVARSVVEKGWGLINMHVIPMSLEEIFLELTSDESTGD